MEIDMNDNEKYAKIKRNLERMRKAGYPLIRDVKAENAVEIMAELLARKALRDSEPGVIE
jgi:hypothetical protein